MGMRKKYIGSAGSSKTLKGVFVELSFGFKCLNPFVGSSLLCFFFFF